MRITVAEPLLGAILVQVNLEGKLPVRLLSDYSRQSAVLLARMALTITARTRATNARLLSLAFPTPSLVVLVFVTTAARAWDFHRGPGYNACDGKEDQDPWRCTNK